MPEARVQGVEGAGDALRALVGDEDGEELQSGFDTDETVVMQGVIDAFFLEDGKVVVVDYKTDRVDDSRILIDRYQAQLDYYERALRQILNVSGSEKVIYSVSLSREIRL